MSEYIAKIIWKRNGQTFIDSNYSRAHTWAFDGGLQVPASSSPHVIPPPLSNEANVDPEEAFVAALSSCHMLFFLSLTAKLGFIIDEYKDNAIGFMLKNAEGRLAMSKVILRPRIQYSGENRPSQEQIISLHDQSHELCFIANSVKTRVETEIL